MFISAPLKRGRGGRKTEKTRQQFFPNSGTLHPDKELMPCLASEHTHLLVWVVTACARQLKREPERKMPLLTQKLGILHRWGTASPHWCHSGTADTEITDKALQNFKSKYTICYITVLKYWFSWSALTHKFALSRNPPDTESGTIINL
jgi:hypothetical protein